MKNKKVKNKNKNDYDEEYQSTLSYIFQNDDQEEEEEEDDWGFFVELDNVSIYTKKCFKPKVIKQKIIPTLPTIQEEQIEEIEQIQEKKPTIRKKTVCYIAISLFILSFLLLF